MSLSEMIHYRHPNHFIGDVHPFYDTTSHRWFLYYLLPGGTFQSHAAISRDLMHWEDTPLSFENTPRAPYYVVAVIKHKKVFYSWYGQQFTHVCSVSDDGIHWRANPSYDIPVNKMASPLGERDPFVTFDKDRGCFYEIALAYVKSMTDCAITFKKTIGSDLNLWEWLTIPLIHFPNTSAWEYGEPECPQLIKIGRRWYVFASLAHRTVHHVGGFSYWIGDIDVDPEKVDWDHKQRHVLTSEDLCATQLAWRNHQLYAMGWIPQNAQGNEWGGHVNSPMRVRSSPDGLLWAEPDPGFWFQWDLKPIFEIQKPTNVAYRLPEFQLFALHATWTGENITTWTFKNTVVAYDVTFNPKTQTISVKDATGYVFAFMPLFEEKNRFDVFMVINRDILEVSVNRKTVLHARVSRPITNDDLIIDAPWIEKLTIATIHPKEEE